MASMFVVEKSTLLVILLALQSPLVEALFN